MVFTFVAPAFEYAFSTFCIAVVPDILLGVPSGCGALLEANRYAAPPTATPANNKGPLRAKGPDIVSNVSYEEKAKVPRIWWFAGRDAEWNILITLSKKFTRSCR